MTNAEAIEKFTHYVNQHLPEQVDVAALQQFFVDDKSFETLLSNYEAACQPQQFSDMIVTHNDMHLDQAYGLLEATFTPDVLRPRRDYRSGYSHPQTPRTSAMISRRWHVAGAQKYDTSGQLIYFNPDPLSATSGVAGVVTGGCMNLADAGRPTECIGTISYLAVRPALRRKGHGKSLLDTLEAELKAVAAEQGWQMRLIVLEAEDRATEFWSSCNFLWPEQSQYLQPSIQFDTKSGQPLFSAMPETLMLRLLEPSFSECIERALLLDVVRTIYTRWYVPRSGPPEAIAHARENIENLFEQFSTSLPSGDLIPLVRP